MAATGPAGAVPPVTLASLMWGQQVVRSHRALQAPAQLLNYTAVDLTSDGLDEAMRERDEFNFSVNLQLSGAPVAYVRRNLVAIAREQWARSHGTVT